MKKQPLPYSLLALVLGFLLTGVPCRAAEVLIIADAELKPVMDVTLGVHKTLHASTKTYSPSEVRGNLAATVSQEEARVVITLGQAALAEALELPPTIPVIYDLVVFPSATTRPNTTGFFMATPVGEYTSLIKNHLYSIKEIAVLGRRAQLDVLAGGASPATAYSVNDSVEFVKTVNRLESANAILLLPDSAVLTATAINEVYLYSFRKGIPILGVSERNVREGALVALVVDMVHVGQMIGETATKALKGMDVGKIPPSPPKKFDLFLNTATATKMGIPIPDEVVRMATRVYP